VKTTVAFGEKGEYAVGTGTGVAAAAAGAATL